MDTIQQSTIEHVTLQFHAFSILNRFSWFFLYATHELQKLTGCDSGSSKDLWGKERVNWEWMGSLVLVICFKGY